AYVATLSEAQLTQLTDAAGWSVKDHLIHLAVWEDGIWALLNQQDRAVEMGVDAEAWKRWNFEEINGIIQQQHKDESWAEVERKRQASHQRFVAQIEATSEADLERPARDFQTNSTSNSPIIQIITGDAFAHYDTHLPWIKTIVENGHHG
ncbi:MAG: ClbS/DfsB family four-helix bundle protein, partial [Anaerolineae bacterium]|nr:ClbS/DfsB family four-helix bundle protein [Anaerolineae bacterium]